MMHSFSKEAMERPYRTLEAAKILREKAAIIARATTNARADEVVVAVIHEDLSFGGVWTLAREDLMKQIPIVEEEGGWSLIFSPHTLITHVEKRCDELARLAQKRGQVMRRWAARHPHDISE